MPGKIASDPMMCNITSMSWNITTALNSVPGQPDEAEPDGGRDLHEGLVEADELRGLDGRREDGEGEQQLVVLRELHGHVEP